MRILPASVLALSSILSLYSSSSSQQEKKSQMPDFFQTHKELKYLGGKACAHVSISNILTYLDINGFPNMLKAEIPNDEDQLELVKLLASKEYMATGSHGTNPPFVMKGLEKYVKDKGYKIEIKYKGFEGDKYLTDKNPLPRGKDDKSSNTELYKFTPSQEVSLLRDRDLPKELVSSKDHWSVGPKSVPHRRALMILEGIIIFKVSK